MNIFRKGGDVMHMMRVAVVRMAVALAASGQDAAAPTGLNGLLLADYASPKPPKRGKWAAGLCLFSAGVLAGVASCVAVQALSAGRLREGGAAIRTMRQAKAFLDRAAKVDAEPMRFNNTCFYAQQKHFENRLLEGYVGKMAAQARGVPVLTEADLSFQQHCERWIAESTDATWHAVRAEDRAAAVEKYFAKDFESEVYGYGVGGHQVYRGRAGLKELIETKLKVFPDLKIRVLNSMCKPAVHDSLGLLGFFTAMPDLSEGTMLGDMRISVPGGADVVLPATGKRVAYFGNAVTFVALDPDSGRWQYVSEIVTHDEASMFAEMGEAAWEAIRPRGDSASAIVERLAGGVEACGFPEPWYGGAARGPGGRQWAPSA